MRKFLHKKYTTIFSYHPTFKHQAAGISCRQGGLGMNFPPPPCISGTAIGRDLKFYRDYNWFKPRSHTNFQVNPIAPAAQQEADIRKTSILFFRKSFFTQMALISAVVGIFDRSHPKAKMKNVKRLSLFFRFSDRKCPKKGSEVRQNFDSRFFDEIANNSKTAAPRDLKLRFLAESGIINPLRSFQRSIFSQLSEIVRASEKLAKIGSFLN